MKVIIEPLQDKTAREIGAKGSKAKSQPVRDADGQLRQGWAVELRGDQVERDLTYVFGRSVAEARRENKRITGHSSGRL